MGSFSSVVITVACGVGGGAIAVVLALVALIICICKAMAAKKHKYHRGETADKGSSTDLSLNFISDDDIDNLISNIYR